MDLSTLLGALTDPRVYPHPAGRPEIVHTHASAVVLAGEHVYKLKKPVDLGFLDYSTLERRKAMCAAEVELNRRLAPGVYLGVVPITLAGGSIALGGEGEIVEYAVHMRRLPDEARLARRVLAGTLARETLERIARKLAAFHRDARRGPEVARWASFEYVRANCRDNFAALEPHADSVAPPGWLARLSRATEAELERRSELIRRRAAAGVPCETHGDLRLEHVYLLDDGEPCIVDCIEFSERYRCADPVADVAFLVMDLRAHGAWDAAAALLDAYLAAAGDEDGRALVALYSAYRSTVRAKVRALQAVAPGIPDEQRAEARQLARAHLQLALGELTPPSARACLVLVAGLPGTGKSTLARALAGAADFAWLRSDAIRKELAGLDPLAPVRSDLGAGIYSPAWNERTYGECLARAAQCLARGRRVLVDANFKEERRRSAFLDAAREQGVPARILECVSRPELVRERLERRAGDPSDADWSIHEHARASWEPFGERSAAVRDRVDTAGSPATSLAQALTALAARGLAGERGPR